MRSSFKPAEGKDRLYTRRIKMYEFQLLRDKLPNEFRESFDDYNHRNCDYDNCIDKNDYS